MNTQQQLEHIRGIEEELFRLLEQRARMPYEDPFLDKRISALQSDYSRYCVQPK